MNDSDRTTGTVLVVEDDPLIARFVTRGLAAHGYAVEWVATGGEALARIDAGGVILQLLDLGLPDVDGLEVLQRLLQRACPVPTIVITARRDDSDRALAFDRGASAYLTKPFPLADLLAAVRSCVGMNGTHRQG